MFSGQDCLFFDFLSGHQLAGEGNIFLFVILENEHEQEIILEMVNISISLFASILYFPIVTLSQQSSLAAI